MKKHSILPATFLLTGLFSFTTATNASGLNKFIENSVIEGAIEIEAGFLNDYAGESSSDIAVATVELIIDSTINEKITTHILLLHEEDETSLEVDEASISINVDKGFNITAGQLYLPFGNYETNMISDSLPLEFAEARETAIQLDYETGPVSSSFYIFNGDVLENGADDSIASMGLNIAYATDDMTIGFSYTNNLTDGDLITDTTGTVIDAYVSGMSVYATASFGKTSVFVEHISAIDAFDAADLTFNATGAKPTATNLEAGFELNDAVIAVAFQASSEAVDLGLPETRLLLSYSMEIMKETSLAFELASDSDYSVADGGSGEKASALTAQLAIAF